MQISDFIWPLGTTITYAVVRLWENISINRFSICPHHCKLIGWSILSFILYLFAFPKTDQFNVVVVRQQTEGHFPETCTSGGQERKEGLEQNGKTYFWQRISTYLLTFYLLTFLLLTFLSIDIYIYCHSHLMTFLSIDISVYWHLYLLAFLSIDISIH